MSQNYRKNIRNIAYNNIGLVDSILFSNGAKVAYTYGLNGEKLKVAHWTNLSSTTSTNGPIHSGIIIPSNIKTTEYLGDDVELEGESMIYGKTYKYYFGDGYVRFYPGSSQSQQYYFYSKDHLGRSTSCKGGAFIAQRRKNVRSVVTKNPTTNEIAEVQQTHYYPFGGIIADISTGTSVQNKLYNGQGSCQRAERKLVFNFPSAAEAQPKVKELDSSNNLWWYDYGARQYDPTAPRFTTPDLKIHRYFTVVF